MMAQQPYQVILPLLLRARAIFKPHADAPRGQYMFGLLIVAFRTPHDGGTLTTRHRGREWAFDSATALSTVPPFSIGDAAFFSDIRHEGQTCDVGLRVILA